MALGGEDLHIIGVEQDGGEHQDKSDAADQVEQGAVQDKHLQRSGVFIGEQRETGGGQSAHGLKYRLGKRELPAHHKGDAAHKYRDNPQLQHNDGAVEIFQFPDTGAGGDKFQNVPGKE